MVTKMLVKKKALTGQLLEILEILEILKIEIESLLRQENKSKQKPFSVKKREEKEI